MFDRSGSHLQHVADSLSGVSDQDVARISLALVAIAQRGGIVYVIGNGGSATLASHAATDAAKTAHAGAGPALVSLADNGALMTMIANDYGFEFVFSYQLENLLRPIDGVFIISGSGQSRNVVRAADVARMRGITVLALLGFNGGAVEPLSDVAIVVPSFDYAVIEDAHHAILHAVAKDLAWRRPTETKAVVLDRDGVLLRAPAPGTYICGPTEYEWIPGAREAVRALKSVGLRVVVATNQRGISLGLFGRNDVDAIHEKMQQELAEIGTSVDAFYVCPHGLDDGCRCRKPRSGLLESAAADFRFQPAETVVIGDSDLDIAMAERVGARAVLVGARRAGPIGVKWCADLETAVPLVVGEYANRLRSHSA